MTYILEDIYHCNTKGDYIKGLSILDFAVSKVQITFNLLYNDCVRLFPPNRHQKTQLHRVLLLYLYRTHHLERAQDNSMQKGQRYFTKS